MTAMERKAVLEFFWQNGWQATVAAYPISKSTLYNWLKAWEKGGEAGLRPRSRRPKRLKLLKVTPEMLALIRNYWQEHPKASAKRIQTYLRHNKKCPLFSIMTIWRALQKIKAKSTISAETNTNPPRI